MATDEALQITGVQDASVPRESHSGEPILRRAYEPQEYPALRVESVAKKPAFVSPAAVSLQIDVYEGRVG